MSTASELIAKGRAAVEAELTVIENELAAAVSAAQSKKDALAAELKTYLAAHASEVQTAQSLIARATGVVAQGSASVIPAATLAANTPGSLWVKVKAFLGGLGWKGAVTVGLILIVLHYLHAIGRL